MRFHEIAKLLNEVNMSPSFLASNAALTNVKCGIEFEMISKVSEGDNSGDSPVASFNQIYEAFSHNGVRAVSDMIADIRSNYYEWRDEKIHSMWDSEKESAIDENLDYDEIFEEASENLNFPYEEHSDESIILWRALTRRTHNPIPPELKEWYSKLKEECDRIKDDKIEEAIAENNDLYERAFEEFSENFDDYHNDTEEGDYLKYKYPSMEYIAIEFGLHLDGLDINTDEELRTAADIIEEIIGRTVVPQSGHGEDSEFRGTEYILEEDSSVGDIEDGEFGIELVSPILSLDEMVEDLRTLHAEINESDSFYTDSTCGLHMNVSVPNMEQNLDYVKLVLFLGDKYILKQFGRQYNNYCESMLKTIENSLEVQQDDIMVLLNKLRTDGVAIASKAIHRGITSKYVSINNHGDRIEFRSPGGDWLNTDVEKLITTLHRFCVALSISCDAKAHRQEYFKKLYSLLSSSIKTTDGDAIQIFTKYMSGLLNRDDLKDALKTRDGQRKAANAVSDLPSYTRASGGNRKFLIYNDMEGTTVGFIIANNIREAAKTMLASGLYTSDHFIVPSSAPVNRRNPITTVGEVNSTNAYILVHADGSIWKVFTAKTPAEASAMADEYRKKLMSNSLKLEKL